MEEQIINCIVNQTTDWWSIIANIVMAVASVANLIIIICIFKKEQQNNNKKEIKDEKKSWYDSLGMRKLTSNISDLFLELKSITFDFYNDKIDQEEYKCQYKDIENKLLLFKNEYLTIVDCLNSEKTSCIREIFHTIQDQLYKLMTNYIGDKNINQKNSFQKINIDFDDLRKEIIKISINII